MTSICGVFGARYVCDGVGKLQRSCVRQAGQIPGLWLFDPVIQCYPINKLNVFILIYFPTVDSLEHWIIYGKIDPLLARVIQC
jgi:hypothetical protein